MLNFRMFCHHHSHRMFLYLFQSIEIFLCHFPNAIVMTDDFKGLSTYVTSLLSRLGETNCEFLLGNKHYICLTNICEVQYCMFPPKRWTQLRLQSEGCHAA